MKLSVVGDQYTRWETIERLVQEVPKLFPAPQAIGIVDSEIRYEIDCSKTFLWDGKLDESATRTHVLVDKDASYWLNIRRLVQDYRPSFGEATIILTHVNFIDIYPETLRWHRLPGKQYTMFAGQRVGDEYGGSCDYLERWIVAGIPNEPLVNNTKVVAHELGHLLMSPLYRKEVTLEEWNQGKRTGHCQNYVNNSRCLMHTPHSTTHKHMDEVGLKFCEECIMKLLVVHGLL